MNAAAHAVEVELKFQVPAAHRAALRRAVATASARSTRMQAVYADTAEHHLAAAGLALRLRKEGRVWVQTLKGRGDGLMQRLEHEVRLPPQPAALGMPVIDRSRHAGTPAGAALDAALAALGEGGELLPLYRTDIRRLHRRVRHAGAVIEIAYDSGRILAGERWLAVDEIEFELVSGAQSALPELAARWAARHGLWWDVRTKSERGLRLALGLAQVPAVKAAAMRLPEGAGPRGAWSAMLQAALAQALPNAAEMAAGTAGPEHLHQLRVALRRLRTALALFAPWSPDAEAALALEAQWRQVFGRLSAARDADVISSTLLPQLQALGAPLLALPAAAPADDPAAVVREAAFSGLLLQTLAMSLPAAGANEDQAPLADAARRLLKLAWRRAWADAAVFAKAPPEQRHRARKRLKRLRYALEFVLPLYRAKPARNLHRSLCNALDALGQSNDLQVAEDYFKAQVQANPGAWFALGWLAAQRAPALQRALDALARLEMAPKVWRRG